MKVSGDIRKLTTTQRELARAIGVTQQQVSNLVKQGTVVRDDADKSGGVLIFESVKRYYQGRAAASGQGEEEIDINRERALHEAADRKIAELKLAKMESRAYDARTVELVMTEQLSNLRTQLLGLPTKLAPLLAGKTREEIYETLTGEIKDKLSELSEYSPALFADEEYLEAGQDDEAGN